MSGELKWVKIDDEELPTLLFVDDIITMTTSESMRSKEKKAKIRKW